MTPEKEVTTSGPVKVSCLERIGNWCSFEEAFFKGSYIRGEHQLDRVLKNLLTLVDSCTHYEYKGRTILINRTNARENILKQNTLVRERYKSCMKREGNSFSYLEFMIQNSIPLDTMNGSFPLVFQDFRRTIHCLRLSWAFYLTMKMKKMDKFSFSQRIRKGSWKKLQKNHISEIFIHLYQSLLREKISDEKSIIKCFKNSLCFHVSISLDQDELPQGARIDLVPHQFKPFFRKMEKEKEVNFFFSLLQSKVLCEEVPESFVQDTLETHRIQLSSEHPGVTESALQDLYKRGQEFGKIVRKYYKPLKGFLPTNKATCHFPRDRGGVKGDLVFHERLQNGICGSDPHDRMEPFVVGLFGQPGQGKSSMIPRIISIFRSLFPNLPLKDLTYERTCNVEFWDGYRNQPIVILDDIGQKLSGTDISEFQTLVSCNPYILPMANLEDKGQYFNSPIIILTSNLKYGSKLRDIYPESSRILDDASFWRRIHMPLYCESHKFYSLKEEPCWVRSENLLFNSMIQEKIGKRHCQSQSSVMRTGSAYFQVVPEMIAKHGTWEAWQQNIWKDISIDSATFAQDLISKFKFRSRFHENIQKYWTQTIATTSDDTRTQIGREFYSKEVNPLLPKSLGKSMMKQSDSNTFKLEFEAYPPEGPLPVRVEPIREPLKVRTITAGIGDTFCLKPFQHAMWQALGEEPQFCLTHGTNRLDLAIQRIYSESESDDVWISGDYTAATDSFSIEASEALLKGILESIDHEPTRRWALKEISPHLLIYPKSSGLSPVLQKSGQLMGSLLSFPLLCLLNDCTARSIGLSPKKYLINGDDILMRANAQKYPVWKECVKNFGLSLSLGKNYIHKSFGTVNSQLILEDKVQCSGKQRVLDRRVQVLGECLRDLEMNMDATSEEVHELFKSVNRTKLSKTVRSINVPLSHGGLAFSWANRDNIDDCSKRTEILVYIYELLKRIEPQSGCLAVPYLSAERFVSESSKTMEDSFNEFIESKEYQEDFLSSKALPFVQKRLMKNFHLRELFLNQKIEDLPPLNFLQVLQIPCSDKTVIKDLQVSIDQTFFKLFLNGNSEYTYDLFRQLFISSSMNIKLETKVSTEFLVKLTDLNVQPDFLTKIPVNYVPKEFDSEIFKKQMCKALEPKQFYLPEFQDSKDFSRLSVEYSKSIQQEMERFLSFDFQIDRKQLLQDIRDRRP